MARAESDDLHRKLLEAYREREGSLAQLAGRFVAAFSVSATTSVGLLNEGFASAASASGTDRGAPAGRDTSFYDAD